MNELVQTTYGEILKSLEGERIYSVRQQEKSSFRIYARFRHFLPYTRFQALFRSKEIPANAFEEELLSFVPAFLGSLADTSNPVTPFIPTRPYPTFEPSASMIEVVEGVLAWAKECDGDDAIKVSLVDLCFQHLGLGPIYHRSNDRCVLWEANTFLDALATTARPSLVEEAEAEKRRSGFSLEALPAFLSSFPLERAIVFGSFARGLQIPESDVDLGVMFVPCLTAKEKEGIIADMKEKGYVMFGVHLDFSDFLFGDEASLDERYGQHIELDLNR